jgi:hypothetical protein
MNVIVLSGLVVAHTIPVPDVLPCDETVMPPPGYAEVIADCANGVVLNLPLFI